jgi:hypothetical protein
MSIIAYCLLEAAMVVSTQALKFWRRGLKIYLSEHQPPSMPTWVHVLAPSSKRDCISGDPQYAGHVEELSAKYETGVIDVII